MRVSSTEQLVALLNYSYYVRHRQVKITYLVVQWKNKSIKLEKRVIVYNISKTTLTLVSFIS